MRDKRFLRMFPEDKNGLRSDTLIPSGTENQTDIKEKYFVSDLVWGKVKSHPWWPGQILEPLSASVKVMKYFKNDCYLVSYFGDQTFAWNDASNLKPFGKYFLEMEKQSSVETFRTAVDSALDEVSRKVECGLVCGCLPDDVIDLVKCHVVSAATQVQSTLIFGRDSLFAATPFVPAQLADYLKSLAESPKAVVNRLQCTTARAQLLAFKRRWRGCYELPAIEAATPFVPARLANYLKSLAEAPKSVVNRLQFTTARAQLLAFKRWKGCYELPAVEEFTGILKKGVTDVSRTQNFPHVDENSDEYSPTLLILNLNKLESIPSTENLNKIFTQYGPLHELDTKILCKGKRAKMLFKRRSDADAAFSRQINTVCLGFHSSVTVLNIYQKHTKLPPPQKLKGGERT